MLNIYALDSFTKWGVDLIYRTDLDDDDDDEKKKRR